MAGKARRWPALGMPCLRRAGGRSLAAAVLAGVIAGCVSPPPRAPAPLPLPGPAPQARPDRQPEVAAFRAVLSGQETVPPAPGGARGELLAVLDRRSGVLQWKLSFTPLSGPVRAAHFHGPAMGGELAEPVVSLGRAVVSPAEGRALLTPRQRADLLAGQWYVNLSTARFPEGELRGQLIEQR